MSWLRCSYLESQGPSPSQKGTADLLRLAEKSSFLLYLSLRPPHQLFFSLTAGAGSLRIRSKEAVWLVSWVENTPPPLLILPPWVCVSVSHQEMVLISVLLESGLRLWRAMTKQNGAEVMVVFLDFWAHKRPGSFLVLLEPSHHAMSSPSSMERSTWRTIEVLQLKC